MAGAKTLKKSGVSAMAKPLICGSLKAGLSLGVDGLQSVVAEPLISIGLKAVLGIPVEGAVEWVKQRFTDHSQALPIAIAAANDRAWQAVSLALAGDSIWSRMTGFLRDGDMKAVRDQIRLFVHEADTGLVGTSESLRTKACDELNRLKREGRFSRGVLGPFHSLAGYENSSAFLARLTAVFSSALFGRAGTITFDSENVMR